MGFLMKVMKDLLARSSTGFLVNERFFGLKYTSPHKRRPNSSGLTPPKVSEYIFAKDWRVKLQPISVQAKRTLPFSGLSLIVSAWPGRVSAMIVLTSSIAYFSLK